MQPQLLRNTVLFTSLLFLIFSIKTSGQHTADSIHRLLTKAGEKRQGELNVDLATYYISRNPDSAIYFSNNAIKIADRINDHVIVIRSYAKIAEAWQTQNKMKEAIANYLKGLELAEKYNENSLKGTLYNGMGTCYFYQNDIVKAERYLRLAARAKRDAKDYQYYAIISINLSSLQVMKQAYREAITTLKEAEKTLITKRQNQYLPTLYNSMGAAYQGIKPDSCIYFYEKSAALSLKYNDVLSQMTANQNMGDYYLDKRDFTAAIKYMKMAIAVNDKRPEDQFKPALYDRIALAYATAGDFKNAYHYRKLESEARQRIFSVQKQKEVDELEIKYETEKKEKEIQRKKQEIERGNNQRNLLLFGGMLFLVIAGAVVYLIFQRRKITLKFEQEKLRMFENIFHEIRTPLTLIDGPIQVIKNDVALKNTEQLLLLERNSKRLMRLVNELLDASKLGRGTFRLHYTNGNLGGFINDIADSFAGEALSEGKTVARVVDIEGNYSFPSDALEKILSNLLANAVKYTGTGGQVKLAAFVVSQRLVISIEDDGPGIPDNEKKKVFKRFFRGRHSKGTNGTGIGLSLVKELVGLANGSITMESSASGTAFKVSIPLQEPEVSHQAENTDTPAGAPTLLLVEDDADTASFTISVLQDNFRIAHAKNGREALELLGHSLPDIVLSDVMMPEKDGIDLLKDIRSNELYSHLPFVLFSAKASLESRLEGLSRGADAYIAKPFSPHELSLTVRNLFTIAERNRQRYQASIKSDVKFEDRVRSENAYVNKIIECIVRNISDSGYSVNELSSDMAVSRSQLHRKLTALTGFSTTNFIRMIRLEKAKDMLANNEGNVSEIAYRCGFNSQSYFTKSFSEHFGGPPSQFSKNQ